MFILLLGEHIDYCGYGVLPMAIEQDMVIAVAKSKEDKLFLADVEEIYRWAFCSSSFAILGLLLKTGNTLERNTCTINAYTSNLNLE